MIETSKARIGGIAGALDYDQRRGGGVGDSSWDGKLWIRKGSVRQGIRRRCGAIGMASHRAVSEVVVVRHTAIRILVV